MAAGSTLQPRLDHQAATVPAYRNLRVFPAGPAPQPFPSIGTSTSWPDAKAPPGLARTIPSSYVLCSESWRNGKTSMKRQLISAGLTALSLILVSLVPWTGADESNGLGGVRSFQH